MTLKAEVIRSKKDLVSLFEHIHHMREELAALGNPDDNKSYFASMADLLVGIAEETDTASDKILSNMETFADLLMQIRERTAEDRGTRDLLDQVENCGNAVLEACSFQDLTGQRVVRITKTLRFVENKIKQLLVSMWGRDELTMVMTEFTLDELEETPDKKLLRGPQRRGVAVTQGEIDKLFG